MLDCMFVGPFAYRNSQKNHSCIVVNYLKLKFSQETPIMEDKAGVAR